MNSKGFLSDEERVMVRYKCTRDRDISTGDPIDTDAVYYMVRDMNRFLCVIERRDKSPYCGEMRWTVQKIDLVEVHE